MAAEANKYMQFVMQEDAKAGDVVELVDNTKGRLRRYVSDPPTPKVPTTAELIGLCARGIVMHGRWSNRDTAAAQMQLGEAFMLLNAGCPWKLSDDQTSDERMWWIDVVYRGFNWFEDGDGHEGTRHFYIPTSKCLDKANGSDWYC